MDNEGSKFSFDQLVREDEDFEWEQRNQSVSYINHCIAGSIAGIMEHIVMLPVDNIKTHMQVLKKKMGFFNTMKYIYNKDGIIKFWNGASIIASGCIPAHACYFSIYEFSKAKLLTNTMEKWHPYIYGLTGVFATMVHDAIISPIDMLKQRAQLAPPHLRKFSTLIRHIIQQEGFLSLYRSFPITMFMNLPTSFFLVSANENLKALFKPEKGHTYLSWFLCAGAAGAFASALTIPMDVIKTKLQTQNCFGLNDTCVTNPCNICPVNQEATNNKPLDALKKEKKNMSLLSVSARFFNNTTQERSPEGFNKSRVIYSNAATTIKKIIAEEGYRGFFKGIVPRMLAQAPSAAISWTTYEILKKYLAEKSNAI